MSAVSSKSSMAKILRDLSYRRDLYVAFRDTMEMLASALSNQADLTQRDKREARYLEIAKAYSPDELQSIAGFLAQLVEAMETQFSDYLGELFMELELSNDAKGQFFTPFSLSQLMAALLMDRQHVEREIQDRGFICMQEPAAGSGGMVLAYEAHMRSIGLGGRTHVTCMDVDLKTVHMAYIQLSLAGIPAILMHGNTLTLEQWGVWYTPVHIWEGWGYKLRRAQAETVVEAESVASLPAPVAQLDLFGVPA